MLHVIPYFEVPTLGPIQPWGTLVAAGVVIGLLIGVKRAPKVGLDGEMVSRLTTWILVGGFVGARLMHVFAYRWVDYQDNLGDIVKAWEGGMSSYGGFLGAAIGGVWFLVRNRVDFWRYADVASYAFIPGWTIGRLGCFAIHDHPGRLSDFFLAVRMDYDVELVNGRLLPAARHDLGLYDGILTLAIWLFFVVADRKPRYAGFFLGWMCALYAVPRFFLDYLRATDLASADTRYAGLTPAQYGSIVLVLLGGWILWSRRQTAAVQKT